MTRHLSASSTAMSSASNTGSYTSGSSPAHRLCQSETHGEWRSGNFSAIAALSSSAATYHCPEAHVQARDPARADSVPVQMLRQTPGPASRAAQRAGAPSQHAAVQPPWKHSHRPLPLAPPGARLIELCAARSTASGCAVCFAHNEMSEAPCDNGLLSDFGTPPRSCSRGANAGVTRRRAARLAATCSALRLMLCSRTRPPCRSTHDCPAALF